LGFLVYFNDSNDNSIIVICQLSLWPHIEDKKEEEEQENDAQKFEVFVEFRYGVLLHHCEHPYILHLSIFSASSFDVTVKLLSAVYHKYTFSISRHHTTNMHI
jgi:hypothetical protein